MAHHSHRQDRHKRGTPTGGRWAATAKDAATGVTLTEPPADTPISEQIRDRLADVEQRFEELRKERQALARASLAAYVTEIEPKASKLRWEIEALPAYHTGELEGRSLYFDKLLDADGKPLDIDEGDYDAISDSLEEYSNSISGLHRMEEGTTGEIDLDAALAPYRTAN